MGLGDINISNVKDVIVTQESFFRNLPPELVVKMSGLIGIFKIAGILFIIYLVIVIVGIVMGILRDRRIKRTYRIVKELEEKINFLVEREKNRELSTVRKRHKGHRKKR